MIPTPGTAAAEPAIDVLGVGETLIQLTPPEGSDVETGSALLLSTAGAESNVVSHLAQMGHRTAMVTAVGADPWGRRILGDLHRAGVDCRRVRIAATAPTGLYLKSREEGRSRVHYHRAGSAASRMGPVEAESALAAHPRVLHTSGILPALSSSCAELAARLGDRSRNSMRLSFDVNHRPALWSAERAAPVLLALARSSDIVFVGRDEAETLWGCHTDRDVRGLLPEPEHLVVKDDHRPAVEWHGDQRRALRPPLVTVREAVGAGDAFAAGWLSAYLDEQDHDPHARLARGHRVAALVLASLTDHPEDSDALRAIRGSAQEEMR